ncbi:hypothetical protein AB0861_027060, partial [Acinetobacter baumannii]
ALGSLTLICALANFKIQMTAKLCQQLYQNGYVRYIQITAIKK